VQQKNAGMELEMNTTAWHQHVLDFHTYWTSLRHGDTLPAKSWFDPAAVPHLLASLWVIEIHQDPLRFRTRLAGTHFREILGQELTGNWIDALYPDNQAELPARLIEVVETGKRNWRRGRPNFRLDHGFCEVENIILPFAEDGHVVDYLILLAKYYPSNGRFV
jgi:hypothetical protein